MTHTPFASQLSRMLGLVLALAAAGTFGQAWVPAAEALAEAPTSAQAVSPAPVTQSGIAPRRDGTPLGRSSRSRAYFDHGRPSPCEQLMLELVNRTRADPAAEAARLGISLNEGLPPGTISDEPKPPLALHPALIQAARNHSQWMLETDTFNHIGVDGTDPGDRMTRAGYPFTGSWTWSENISWGGTTGFLDREARTRDRHAALFRSPGHRNALCDPGFPDVGIGIVTGTFTKNTITYNALMVTQDFARSSGSPAPYILGVVYNDANGNNAYDIGEGVAGVSVVVENGDWETATSASGGYAVPYTGCGALVRVVFSGNLPAGPVMRETAPTGQNIKIDLDTSDIQEPAQVTLTYVAGSHGTIQGQAVQVIERGEDGFPVVATPDPGFVFSHWSDGVLTAMRTDLTVTANLTVTATFEPDPAAPVVRLLVDDGSNAPVALVLGETEEATEDFDRGLDIQAPDGQSHHLICLTASDPGQRALVADFRPRASTTRWRLVIGNAPLDTLNLTWDVTNPEPGREIYLQQVDTEQPVGFPVDMREQTALGVAANTEFEIAYAPTAQHTLHLHAGWNLLGNTVMSRQTIGAIFGRETRSGTLPGPVLNWNGSAYLEWNENDAFAPEIGYWLYSDTAEESAIVTGIRPDGLMVLQPGWNLITPHVDCEAPDAAGIVGPVWTWNAHLQTYSAVPRGGVLAAGQGCWLLVSGSETVTIDLDGP